MDRFIDEIEEEKKYYKENLKSSMDRFIGTILSCCHSNQWYLKSSMDRFIEQLSITPSRITQI